MKRIKYIIILLISTSIIALFFDKNSEITIDEKREIHKSFLDNSPFNDFKKLGIDEIFCISVNDSYVMNAWSNYMGVKNVQMIPDGTGQFTRMMGMLVNKDHNGFGMRSWRYAVIANNMEIEQSFVEDGLNDSGTDDDPYIETNPDNIIEFLK